MKIRKFNQILENNNLDKESIMALIQDLSDTYDLEYKIEEGYFSEILLKNEKTYGLSKRPIYKSDKKFYKLIIDLNKNGCESLLSIDPIFKFNELINILKELSSISRVTETHIQFINNKLNFFIISDEPSELNEAHKIFLELREKLSKMNTDFSKSTKIQFYENKVIIKTPSRCYTDRKLSSILKGINLDNFIISKRNTNFQNFNFSENFTINTIELK